MSCRYFLVAAVQLASLVPPVEVLPSRINFPTTLLNHFPPLLHQQELVTKCPGGLNHTTYLRAESFAVTDQPVATLIDITLSECARKCSSGVDGVECHSFEYDPERQTCALKEARGQPFGPSVLRRTPNNGHHTIQSTSGGAFFQRICIPSRELCSAPYAFERFPQHVLSGHSMEVIAANNLSECLAYCLESKRRLQVDCHSVMYYYESGQCIVNREIRRSSPHLFTSDTRFQLVDYFENNCLNVECFGGESPHWIHVEDGNYRVDRGGRDLLLSGVDAAECRRNCEANRVGDDVFPCRAYLYTPSRRECQLSAESALVVKPMSVAAGEGGGTLSNGERIESELTSLSATNYYEKVCISGGVAHDLKCDEESSFELLSSRVLDSSPPSLGRERTIMTASLSLCLQRCLEAIEPTCLSVTFFKRRDECVISERSRFTHPHLFHPTPDADYYDRLCQTNETLPALSHDYSPSHTIVDHSSDDDLLLVEKETTPALGERPPREDSLSHLGIHSRTSMSIEDPVAEVVRGSLAASASADYASSGGKEIDSSHPAEKVGKKLKPSFNLQSKAIVLETECRLSGMIVKATFSQLSSGSLFIKDHSTTCSSMFEHAREANLTIPLSSHQVGNSSAEVNCPTVETHPGVWSFLLVVQRNNIGIASLMTGGDRIFNITCDYTSTLRHNSTTAINVEERKDGTGKAKTQSVRELSPPPPTVKMAILRHGKAVTTVSLGEELELRWWFVKNDTSGGDGLGFLVDNCVAERIEGRPPDPPPLPLVVDGCPDNRVRSQLMRSPIIETGDGGFNTTVRMFRFDGSRRVRIRCAVNICVERCKPASCVFASHDSDREVKRLSYGRRRRRQTMGELAELVERYDRVRNEILASKGLRRRKPATAAERYLNPQDVTAPTSTTDGDDGDASIQQSTTVVGSYTIADQEARDSRTVRREGGVVYVAAEDDSDPVGATEKPMLPTTPLIARNSTLLGLANGGGEKKIVDPDGVKCKPSSTYAIESLTCLPQRAFVALLAAASFVTVVLAFFSIRFIHKRCGGKADYKRSAKQMAPLAPTRSSAASDSLLNFMPSMASSPLADCVPLPPSPFGAHWNNRNCDWGHCTERNGRVTTFGVERRRERPIDANQFPHLEYSPRSLATGRLSSSWSSHHY